VCHNVRSVTASSVGQFDHIHFFTTNSIGLSHFSPVFKPTLAANLSIGIVVFVEKSSFVNPDSTDCPPPPARRSTTDDRAFHERL